MPLPSPDRRIGSVKKVNSDRGGDSRVRVLCARFSLRFLVLFSFHSTLQYVFCISFVFLFRSPLTRIYIYVSRLYEVGDWLASTGSLGARGLLVCFPYVPRIEGKISPCSIGSCFRSQCMSSVFWLIG